MIFPALFSALLLLAVALFLFLRSRRFGRLPRGARQERIERSPHWRDGRFRNLQPTPRITSDRGLLSIMGRTLRNRKQLRPAHPVPAVKCDLRALPADRDLFVWFGHSSYLLQLSDRRFLIDPVFCSAAPLSFLNRPFPGTGLYSPGDLPAIDCLIITHDHWDHLDCRTVMQLRERVGRVVCPLGVGEHFERWGYAPDRLTELDWEETAGLEPGFSVRCLPARHFSGRGFSPDRTLWASFLLLTPRRNVFAGGDGGYGTHFARIGATNPPIDLAVLENGQYSEDWRLIHTMPAFLGRIAKELRAERIITVHHSKYALARHPWDEPLRNEQEAARRDSLNLIVARIGEPVFLED